MINQYRFSAGEIESSFSEFSLTGSDVQTFLQAQSTFDLRNFSDEHFHLVSFLDPRGSTECYGWLLKEKNHYLYLVPALLTQQAQERLNRFLVSEDVEINLAEKQIWFFTIGEDAPALKTPESFLGELFADKAVLTRRSLSQPQIPSEESEIWRKLTGWPSFDGSDFHREIINNNRLFDLSVSNNKGCYPGQETVSKIATHRGSAYAPVLIETSTSASAGIMMMAGSKIGTVTDSLRWQNKDYLTANVLRDFRVEKMKVSFDLNGVQQSGTVRYYPLINGSAEAKAHDLFDVASEHFKKDELDQAESTLKQAIKILPNFADAYESLGVMLGRREKFDEAIQIMRQLAEVDPSSVLAHTNLSLFLMKQGKIEEAEEEKSKATIKTFASFGNEAKVKEQAEAQRKKQQAEWEQREGMFRQVLEIDPDDTLANYGIGSIAVEKHDWKLAIEHLEKVIAADPKYSVAYLALGKALVGVGEKTRAKEVFQAGVKVAAAKGDLMPANQMQSEIERL